MADRTAKQEASQALLCAILDYYVGPGTRNSNGVIKKNKGIVISKEEASLKSKNSYNTLIKKITKKEKITDADKIIESNIYDKMVNTPGVDYNTIKSFLNSEHKWLLSSIYTANSLYNKLKVAPVDWRRQINTYDLIYSRGDENIMSLIEEIFSIINKNSDEKFSNINRWSPADIYFSKKEAKKELNDFKELINQETGSGLRNWTSFNKKIAELVKDYKLLPVSLKLASSNNVSIKFFNVKNLHLKGGRTLKDAKDIIINQYLGLPEKTGDKLIKFEGFYDTIDCRITPIRNIPKGEEVIFTDINMQIRDKGGSSTFGGWNPGVQAVLYAKPSEALAGGMGKEPLQKLFDLSNNEIFEDKSLFEEIAGYVLSYGDGVNEVAIDTRIPMSKEAGNFLKKFHKLHKYIYNKPNVDFPTEAKSVASGNDPIDILLFYLEKRKNTLPTYIRKRIASLKKNKGKTDPKLVKQFEKQMKTNISARNEQYKLGLAQWFYSKYYTLIYSKKLLEMDKKKKRELLDELFLGSFSLSKNSSFFVKAG